MALISTAIPNLINGVSQQPPSLRLKTQAELQENALSSVVSGLSKRPPTQHIRRIPGSADVDNAFIHTIRRDENEFYTLLVTPSSVRVVDKDGVERTVTGDASYLSNLVDPAQELAATTIADYTFILNKNKTVAKATTKSAARNPEALIYVKQGEYRTKYSITITKGGWTYTRSLETMASTQADTAKTDLAEKSIQTDRIIRSLRFDRGVDATYYGSTNGSAVGTGFAGRFVESQATAAPAMPIPGLAFAEYGNVLWVRSTDGSDFEIRASDSQGDNCIFAFKGQTADFKKLPPEGPTNFEIAIVGDNSRGQDDYYVRLSPDADGAMVWKETIKGNIEVALSAATMPHQLVRQADGSFKLQQATYSNRTVGDDETNPFPSFVGQKLNDIFFHRNRLGFLSEENVIFSEAGELEKFNFFRRTVLTGLDADHIDISVANNKVSILKHAVPFNESLLLFSDLTQFRLNSTDILTATTVNIDVTTQFEASLRAAPVGVGRYVFFATKKGEWSGMREYFVDTSAAVDDAADITAHVPNYLSGQVKKIAASSNEDTLLVLTDGEPDVLNVYRYYWQGQQKVQASWSKWRFAGTIINVEFSQSEIYLLMKYGDELSLEKITLGEDPSTPVVGWPVLLDRRQTFDELGDFYKQNNGDLLTYEDDRVVYVASDGTYFRTSAFQDALGYFMVQALNGKPVVIYKGIPYALRYVFSEQVPKNGEEPVTTGELKLRNMSLVYNDTGYFETRVTPAYRSTKISTFNGRVVNSGNNLLNESPTESGTYRFSVFAGAKECTVEIFSDHYKPCIFQSAEWEGFYTLRSRRI